MFRLPIELTAIFAPLVCASILWIGLLRYLELHGLSLVAISIVGVLVLAHLWGRYGGRVTLPISGVIFGKPFVLSSRPVEIAEDGDAKLRAELARHSALTTEEKILEAVFNYIRQRERARNWLGLVGQKAPFDVIVLNLAPTSETQRDVLDAWQLSNDAASRILATDIVRERHWFFRIGQDQASVQIGYCNVNGTCGRVESFSLLNRSTMRLGHIRYATLKPRVR